MKNEKNNLNVKDLFSEDGLKYQGASFSETEKYWIDRAINSSSGQGNFEEFENDLTSAFTAHKANEIPIYDSRIKVAENRLANIEEKIESLNHNRENIISSAKKAKRHHHAKDYAEFKSKRKEIEREIKDVRAKKYKLQLYLSNLRKRNYSPTIRISKLTFYGISIVYISVASILNFPIFQGVMDGIPAGGLLAPIMGIVEGYMCHLIGLCFGMKNKKLGYLVIGVSLLILTFIIFGQFLFTDHGILSSAFIILLFTLGAVTSYIYFTAHFDREIDQYTNQEQAMLSELDKTNDKIEILDQQIDVSPDKEFMQELNTLHKSTGEVASEIKTLENTKSERLEQINALEHKIIAQAKSIFNSMNTFKNQAS